MSCDDAILGTVRAAPLDRFERATHDANASSTQPSIDARNAGYRRNPRLLRDAAGRRLRHRTRKRSSPLCRRGDVLGEFRNQMLHVSNPRCHCSHFKHIRPDPSPRRSRACPNHKQIRLRLSQGGYAIAAQPLGYLSVFTASLLGVSCSGQVLTELFDGFVHGDLLPRRRLSTALVQGNHLTGWNSQAWRLHRPKPPRSGFVLAGQRKLGFPKGLPAVRIKLSFRTLHPLPSARPAHKAPRAEYPPVLRRVNRAPFRTAAASCLLQLTATHGPKTPR